MSIRQSKNNLIQKSLDRKIHPIQENVSRFIPSPAGAEVSHIELIEPPETTPLPPMITNPIDGSEMVLIPAGNFIYGSREDDKEVRSNEKPQQTLYLPDYYMDKYPCTNKQYCLFLNEVNPGEKDLPRLIELSDDDTFEKCRITKERR